MDKVEYHQKLDELTALVQEEDYKTALSLVQEIDWRRVKSIRTLNMVADVYERSKDYAREKEILQIAYSRSSIGRHVLSRLVEVCLKLGEVSEAEKYFRDFSEVAQQDNSRCLLQYKLYKAQNAPLDAQIAVLEEYRDKEYTEQWAYELALLYSRAGMPDKCVEACDDLILWFSEGTYVLKAMELKMKYQPLTASQQVLYEKEKRAYAALPAVGKAARRALQKNTAGEKSAAEPEAPKTPEIPSSAEEKTESAAKEKVSGTEEESGNQKKDVFPAGGKLSAAMAGLSAAIGSAKASAAAYQAKKAAEAQAAVKKEEDKKAWEEIDEQDLLSAEQGGTTEKDKAASVPETEKAGWEEIPDDQLPETETSSVSSAEEQESTSGDDEEEWKKYAVPLSLDADGEQPETEMHTDAPHSEEQDEEALSDNHGEFREKLAKGIRDVFSGVKSAGEAFLNEEEKTEETAPQEDAASEVPVEEGVLSVKNEAGEELLHADDASAVEEGKQNGEEEISRETEGSSEETEPQSGEGADQGTFDLEAFLKETAGEFSSELSGDISEGHYAVTADEDLTASADAEPEQEAAEIVEEEPQEVSVEAEETLSEPEIADVSSDSAEDVEKPEKETVWAEEESIQEESDAGEEVAEEVLSAAEEEEPEEAAVDAEEIAIDAEEPETVPAEEVSEETADADLETVNEEAEPESAEEAESAETLSGYKKEESLADRMAAAMALQSEPGEEEADDEEELFLKLQLTGAGKHAEKTVRNIEQAIKDLETDADGSERDMGPEIEIERGEEPAPAAEAEGEVLQEEELPAEPEQETAEEAAPVEAVYAETEEMLPADEAQEVLSETGTEEADASVGTGEEKPQQANPVKAEETPARKVRYNEELEVPDPEPTEEEKRSRTIPLSKIGQNTVPISMDQVLSEETPEERRIRILNRKNPTRMSDEQRKIFTYFARIPGMDSQILEAISGVYAHAGEKTSAHGNIAIMGAKGTGKTRLTHGIVVAMCQDLGLDAAKVARINGAEMNRKDPAKLVSQMAGGFLIIEDVGRMDDETVAKLNQAMEFRTDCMILIVEDEKSSMRNFLKRNSHFAAKFEKVISIPVFTNDELVTFARTYATENGCKIDELGILALYTLISNNQTEEEPVTISAVKEMVDAAIAHATHGRKRSRKAKSEKGKWIILREKDFEKK